MSEATIRAQIKLALESVDGIGAVYDYERYSRSVAAFFQLMKSGGIVNGWVIHRGAAPAVRDTMPTMTRSHKFRITGIYTLDDSSESEKSLQALVDAIFNIFLSDQTLGSTCVNSDPLQVDDIDVEEFANTLYHTVEMTLICHERVSYDGETVGAAVEPPALSALDGDEVTITCATSGALIYYTIDGSDPDQDASLYSAPFSLEASATVKARAYKFGYTPSGISTRDYTVGEAVYQLISTQQVESLHDGDDGYYQLGVALTFTPKTTGDYSGTTNITLNGKTVALSNNIVQQIHPDDGVIREWTRYYPGTIGPSDNGRIYGYDAVSGDDIWGYKDAANSAMLSGYSDWRVPNLQELISLFMINQIDGQTVVDTIAFPNIVYPLWTSTRWRKNDELNLYWVQYTSQYFITGLAVKADTTYWILLVRGGV